MYEKTISNEHTRLSEYTRRRHLLRDALVGVVDEQLQVARRAQLQDRVLVARCRVGWQRQRVNMYVICDNDIAVALTVDGEVPQGARALCGELLEQPDLLVAAAAGPLQTLRRQSCAQHDRVQSVAAHDLDLVVVWEKGEGTPINQPK